MTTGVSSALPLRLAAATRRRAAIAPVTSISLRSADLRDRRAVSCFPAPMLGRANKSYEARSAAMASTAKPPPKPSLDKVLFPSSSPRDSNITEFYKKPLAGTSQASTFKRWPSSTSSHSRPTATSKPLQSRSPNVANTTAAAAAASTSISGFVTLCGKPGSFADEPVMAISSQASANALQQAEERDLLAYGVSIEDFTDDENLDLDFQTPGALISNPAPPKGVDEACSSTNTEKIAVSSQDVPLNTSLGSALSWASSPPSHLVPPHSRTGADRPQPAKRDMPTNVASDSPLPAAKKRTMPKHWSKPAADEEVHGVSLTPAAKPKGAVLWDATASAVKAQKKQLKDQFKKPAPVEDGGDASVFGGRDSADLWNEAESLQKATKPASFRLSSEQEHVKNLVCYKNASVFFTGPAGTGKSVLMRAIIQDLRKKYAKDPEKLGVAASTGLAACNIGGMTLHSFAGIGLGKEDVQTLVKKIRRNPKAKTRWLKTKTLIIDEISMVDGELFDKLSHIGRTIRNNGRPWGGIQLVLTGDFFQLPPVPDREKRDIKFAFDAATWATSIDHTIGLTEVFRQKDPEFAQMLNEMRLGRISEKTIQTFKSLARPLQFDDGMEVTELFPTRNEVESSNERRLKALPGKSHRYEAFDSGDQAVRDKLLQNMMAPKCIELRVGAQVMLIKNMDESLVNGSLGTVVKFMTQSEYEASGGDILSMMDADTRKRAKILNSYLNSNDSAPDRRQYPLVQFHGVDGSKRSILVRQEEWKVELPNGETQASRSQLPLILAWALSIHKAQGQTLERVKVDLGRVFEKGQAYVALSRATTKSGLQVLRFEKHKVMAHPRVVEFYSKLYSAEAALRGKEGNTSILAFTRNSEVALEPPVSFGQKAAKAEFGRG